MGSITVRPVLFDYLADGLPSMQPFLWPSKSTWSVITQVVLFALGVVLPVPVAICFAPCGRGPRPGLENLAPEINSSDFS